MSGGELADLTSHGLALIEAIIGQLRDAHAGKVTPSEALAKIGELHPKLLEDRDAADKKLHDKFDTTTPPG